MSVVSNIQHKIELISRLRAIIELTLAADKTDRFHLELIKLYQNNLEDITFDVDYLKQLDKSNRTKLEPHYVGIITELMKTKNEINLYSIIDILIKTNIMPLNKTYFYQCIYKNITNFIKTCQMIAQNDSILSSNIVKIIKYLNIAHNLDYEEFFKHSQTTILELINIIHIKSIKTTDEQGEITIKSSADIELLKFLIQIPEVMPIKSINIPQISRLRPNNTIFHNYLLAVKDLNVLNLLIQNKKLSLDSNLIIHSNIIETIIKRPPVTTENNYNLQEILDIGIKIDSLLYYNNSDLLFNIYKYLLEYNYTKNINILNIFSKYKIFLSEADQLLEEYILLEIIENLQYTTQELLLNNKILNYIVNDTNCIENTMGIFIHSFIIKNDLKSYYKCIELLDKNKTKKEQYALEKKVITTLQLIICRKGILQDDQKDKIKELIQHLKLIKDETKNKAITEFLL